MSSSKIIEYTLNNKKALIKTERGVKDYVFNSMKGGNYKYGKVNTDKLLDLLVKESCNGKYLNCGLTPNIRGLDKVGIFLDMDFKDISIGIEEINSICESLYSVYNDIFIVDEESFNTIDTYVFVRNNNLHLYSNVVVEKSLLLYIIKKFSVEFEKNVMKNENSSGQAIIDGLNGLKTGIRLECFNKVGKDRNFTPNTMYKLKYRYDGVSLEEYEAGLKESLKLSCYWDTDYYSSIEVGIKEGIKEKINKEKEEEENEKAKAEMIYFDDINSDLFSKLIEFFNSFEEVKLKKLFNYMFYFRLLMCLKNFLKHKKFSSSKIIKKINDEFFSHIIDIDNNFVDEAGKVSYRLNNKKMLIKNYNEWNNIHFGHLILSLGQYDTELVEEFKHLLKKEDIDMKLDGLWKDYKRRNNIKTDNYCPRFLKTLLDKMAPLNKELVIRYFDKHFVYIQKDDSYFNVHTETTKYKKVERVNIKLEEYKESGFRKFKLVDEENKSVSLLTSIEDSDINFKYKKIDFLPGSFEDSSIYNLFDGFGFSKIDGVITDEHRETFSKYLHYIKTYVCEGDEKQYDYFMCLMATIIQRPEYKNHICPIFYSDEKGTGKSSFTKLLGMTIGNKYSFYGNIDEILEKHSTSNEYKFINVIEELDGYNGNKTIETLKNRIQMDEVNLNKKFKNIQTVKDYVRYFILTNNRLGMLDRNQRRFLCYHFKKVNDPELLNVINEVYEENMGTYAKLFGEYLEQYKVKYNSRVEWIKNRCGSNKINYYIKISVFETILQEIYEGKITHDGIDGDNIEISISELYAYYSNKSNKGFTKKLKVFKDDIKENYLDNDKYNFISLKQGNKQKSKYVINLRELYKTLTEWQMIDGDYFNHYTKTE